MADYFEEDVTGMDAEDLVERINERIRRYPSVQIYRKGRRTILRTFEVELELEGFESEEQ